MTEQQTLVSLAGSVERLSRALDEAHNLAASAVEDRDFAITERDELREQVAELRAGRDDWHLPTQVARHVAATLRAERDGLAATVARVEELAGELESRGGSLASALAKALRAALRGEVPHV